MDKAFINRSRKPFQFASPVDTLELGRPKKRAPHPMGFFFARGMEADEHSERGSHRRWSRTNQNEKIDSSKEDS